jgi:Fic-DOC domain mobile mystery protein B
MGLDLMYIEGQTPIDEEEKDDLLIKTISTRSELDEFEQYNIEKAVEWSLKREFKMDTVLSEQFILEVHKRMFGEVWKWAGSVRKTNKNIGVDKSQVLIRLKCLLNDCRYWIEHSTFDKDEIAIRFKHQLVSIHIFANGNGRHSRLCADILISKVFNKPVFTWGRENLSGMGKARKDYLNAIHDADNGNISALILFARS